ncbi:hypothetical protein CDCA_CDCA09G2700 [Cyanidium caldarium]|uniref:Vps53 N-terminal domain-containing protein n=1 Tax=Cyanidium caldarium TaxID=2771 RepID=A0AAV9IWH8_CYACA|nr:hypothetical protein CDCA_CDCA09G2700 [Cyanidium caldarium]|eukprot:ctg_390.g202
MEHPEDAPSITLEDVQSEADAVRYLNVHFGRVDALEKAPEHVRALRLYLRRLDVELASQVRVQLRARQEAVEALREARQRASMLTEALGVLGPAAGESGGALRGITDDLQGLAEARSNLLRASSQIRELVRAARAVSECEASERAEDWSAAVSPVETGRAALEQLAPVAHLPRIRKLQQVFEAVQKRLAAKVLQCLAEGAPRYSPSALQAACGLADALGESVSTAVAQQFVQARVKAYEQVFAATDTDLTPIETFERSFAWFRRDLRAYDEHWTDVFPAAWRVQLLLSEQLCDALRRIVHRDLEQGKVDVAQLLRALQATHEFEAELRRRLGAPLPWSLSTVFEPYMGAYVSLENERLREALEKALASETWRVDDSVLRRAAAAPVPDESFVFASAKELFLEIKRCMKRCSALTTSQTYFNLHKVFKRHLRRYAEALEDPLRQARLRDKSAVVTTAPHTAAHRLAQQPAVERICSVLVTADYCAKTTEQLAEAMRHSIDRAFADNIRMREERDEYHALAGRCVKALVDVAGESAIEPALTRMRAVNWSACTAVGDVSAYTTALEAALQALVERVAGRVSTLYFRYFMDKLAATFVSRYIDALFSCSRLGNAGVQQLLLDTQYLKDAMLRLPQRRAGDSTAIDATADPMIARYQQHVREDMGRAEAMLKVLLAPEANLLEAFEALVPDAQPDELRHLLEWKGVAAVPAARWALQYALRGGDEEVVERAREEVARAERREREQREGAGGVGAGSGKRASGPSITVPHTEPTTTTATTAPTPAAEVRAFFNHIGERLREARIGDRIEATLDAVQRRRYEST